MRRALPAVILTLAGLGALGDVPLVAAHRRHAGPRPPRPTTTPAATAPPPRRRPATTPDTTPHRRRPRPHRASRDEAPIDGDTFDNRYGTVQVRITVQGTQITRSTRCRCRTTTSARSTSASKPSRCLQPGSAASAERADRHRQRRDLHERELRAVVAERTRQGRQSERTIIRCRRCGASRSMWGTVDLPRRARRRSTPRSIDDCFTWFRRVDDLFSTWRDGHRDHADRPRRARRRATRAPDVRDRARALRADATRVERRVRHLGRRPRRRAAPRPGLAPLDPSGLVKGWAVARAGDAPRRRGRGCFFVNAGGDVLTRGRPDRRRDGWRVGIQHPWERDRVAAVLRVTDAARRDVGPLRTRRPRARSRAPGGRQPASRRSPSSVPTSRSPTAYATAAVVLGPAEGLRWLATRVGYEGMAITDGRAVAAHARVRPLPRVVVFAPVKLGLALDAWSGADAEVARRRACNSRNASATTRCGPRRPTAPTRYAARVPRGRRRLASSSRPASCRSRPARRPRPRWRSRPSTRSPARAG